MIKFNDKTIASVYSEEKIIEKIYKGTLKVYEGWRNLIASGVLPLTLTKCKGVDLVDYKLYGDSIQGRTSNIADLSKVRVSSTTPNTQFTYDNTTGTLELTSTPRKYDYSTIPASDLGLEVGKTYYYGGIIEVTGKQTTNSTSVVFSLNSYTHAQHSIRENGITVVNESFTYTGQNSVNLRMFFNYDSPEPAKVTFRNVYVSEVKAEFEPFKKIPTPEAPVEVESVGEKTHNLLKYPYFETTKTMNGVTFVDNKDGSITVEGVANGYPTFDLSNYAIKLEEGKKYYLKAVGTYSGVNLIFAYKDTEGKIQYLGNGIEWKNEYSNPLLYLQVYSGSTASGTLFPYFVEEKYRNLPYEPYGYRIPVKASSKNLFDNVFNFGYIEASTGVAQTHTKPQSQIYTPNYMSIKPNTEYVMTNGIYNKHQKIRFYDKDKNYIGYSYKKGGWLAKEDDTSLIQVAITPDNAYYVRFELDFNDVETATAVLNGEYPYMLELGSMATDYEPYIEPTTTNIYLDEPLRKLGDYADYVDFENSKVVRKTLEVIYTGEESWTRASTALATGRVFFINISNIKINPKIISNIYKTSSQNNMSYTSMGLNEIKGHQSQESIYVSVSYETLAEFKAFLSEMNASGNPFKVYCQINTPTEETIELPNIPTFKGTTILSVDTTIQPSNVEVIYKGK